MPASSSGLDTAVTQQFAGDGYFGSYVRVTYDFAVSGGAISLITFNPTIPANWVVVDGYFDVVTTFVGAAGTLSMGLETAVDLLAATAIATYGTIGRHAIIPVDTAATSLKTTVARQLTVTIATTPVSAGKMFIFLRGFPSGAA